MFTDMTDERFTPEAEVLWAIVPKHIRNKILTNVFCSRCLNAVTIVDFTGREKNGDVILEGKCEKCGQEVSRTVETSEHDASGN